MKRLERVRTIPLALAMSVLFGCVDQSLRAGSQTEWVNSLKPKGKAGAELTLAANGKTDYHIVLPERPTTQEQKAAEDLRTWLREMTGAEFPAIQERHDLGVSKKFISIGRTNLLSQARLKESGLNLGREGYAIAQRDESLYLMGGKSRGPINAVYALLEEDLGCRWYVGDTSTIAQITELKFKPVPRSFVPKLEIRDPYYYEAFSETWSVRNRTNGKGARVRKEWGGYTHNPPGWFVHTHGTIFNRTKDFKEHPENFSEIGGKRVPRQLCLTNADVLRITTSKVLEALKKNPGAELISVSAFDGVGHCECARCKAIDDENGSPAGSLIYFVNQVAEGVEKEYPHVLVSTLAYLDTLDPPSKVRPRHNVAIQLCNDLHAWRWPLKDFVSSNRPKSKQYRDAVVNWSRICKNIHIWDYFTNFSHYLGPMPNMHVLKPSVKFYMDHDVKGVMFQGSFQGPGGARGPMRSWVMAKLFWDPSLDVGELQRDFAYGYYQEAGPAIAAHYEFLDRIGQEYQDRIVEEMGGIRFGMDAPFLTREFLAKADEHFRRAEALAKGEEILHRVKLEKLPIIYVKLVRGKGFTNDDYMKLLKEFEEITTREKVGHTHEAAPDVHQKIQYWRDKASVNPDEVFSSGLGNVWKIKLDPQEVGGEQKWYAKEIDDAGWADVRSDIGRGWESQGFPDQLGYAWYRQRVMVPKGMNSRKFFWMLFGAVDEDAWIYINGSRAFDHTVVSTGLPPHTIWTTAFKFDARPLLKVGEENVIAVRVYNRLGMGGVWKPVYLVASDIEVDSSQALFDLIREKE